MHTAGVNDTVMRRLRSHAPHLRSLTLGGNCPVTVDGVKELRFMHLESLHLMHLPDPLIGQQVCASCLWTLLCIASAFVLQHACPSIYSWKVRPGLTPLREAVSTGLDA